MIFIDQRFMNHIHKYTILLSHNGSITRSMAKVSTILIINLVTEERMEQVATELEEGTVWLVGMEWVGLMVQEVGMAWEGDMGWEVDMGWVAAMAWECNRPQNKLKLRRKLKKKNESDVRRNRN